MHVELLYGRGRLSVAMPADTVPTVIEKRAMPVVADSTAAVTAALERPVGVGSIPEIAAGAKTACILICDITRPVPNGLFLRPLIERLLGAGVPAEGIVVLVATGLHRPNLDGELAEIVGDPWVQERVRVENHYARDDAAHVDLGRTPRGTPVRLDRRLADADLRIATGLVEPHFMAGYSGGRKVIAPGVAHADTITTFHNHRFMSHPRAANCVLDGNPLHEEQLEVVRMLGGALALNTVIDDARRLAFVNFGEVVESHLEAVAFMRGYAEVRVERRFNTVVTSAAGYPLDKTYYQTVKGMVGAMDIVAEGGDIIIASECSEGIGSPEYVAAQRRLLQLGMNGFLAELAAKDHADIDEWETQMQLKSQARADIHLFSDGLTATDHALTGVTTAASVEKAIVDSVARHGDPSVAVIPEGPYVVPFAD